MGSIFALHVCIIFFYNTGLHLVENGTTGHKDSSSVNRMLPFPFTNTSCMLFRVVAFVASCFQVIFLKYSLKSHYKHAEEVITAVFAFYGSYVIVMSSEVEKTLLSILVACKQVDIWYPCQYV